MDIKVCGSRDSDKLIILIIIKYNFFEIFHTQTVFKQ